MKSGSVLRRGFAALTIATVAFATLGSGEENKAEAVDATSASESARSTETTFKVGDAVKLGDWQITVNKVTDPYQSTNEFSTPEAGKRFVVVNATVVNNSKKAQTVSSMMCFDVRDPEGQKFDATIMSSVDPELDGELAPGSKMKGNVAFEVLQESKDLTLHFKCDLWSSGSAQVKLS